MKRVVISEDQNEREVTNRYSLEQIFRIAVMGQMEPDVYIRDILKENKEFDIEEPLGLFLLWLGDAYGKYADMTERSLCEMGKNSETFYTYVLRCDRDRVLLTVIRKMESVEKTTQYLREHIVPMLNMQTNKKAVMGIHYCRGLDKMQQACIDLVQVMDYNMTVGRGVLLEYDTLSQLKSRNFQYPMEMERRAKLALLNRDKRAFGRCIKVFFGPDRILGCNPKDVKEACLRYCYVMFYMAKECAIFSDGGQPLQKVSKELIRAVTIEELQKALQRFFCRMISGMTDMRTEESSLLVERAKYLMEEYYDQGITLEEIADRLSVSGEYLSSRFKKETGATFTELIRKYRIDKVKELLISTDLRLNQIAEQAGYANPKYMSRVFKNETGFLPLEYRKRNA